MVRIGKNLTIDEREIRYTYTRSPGPGGQNVNKVATRVTLRFDIGSSASLSDSQRSMLRRKLRTRINREGVLRVACHRHRTQAANRREALGRFTALLADALRPRARRIKTKPTRASIERRLAEKARRGLQKRERRRKHARPDGD